MRLIKFRGKCAKGEHKGEWLYGGICTYATERKERLVVKASVFANNGLKPVIPDSIGQCLYLKDMNSKDIYEGDIVLHNSQKFQVAWYRDKACFALKDSSGLYFFHWTSSSVTVIGNITDNPDLMK